MYDFDMLLCGSWDMLFLNLQLKMLLYSLLIGLKGFLSISIEISTLLEKVIQTGNAVTDDYHDYVGTFEYMWVLGLISEAIYRMLQIACDFGSSLHPLLKAVGMGCVDLDESVQLHLVALLGIIGLILHYLCFLYIKNLLKLISGYGYTDTCTTVGPRPDGLSKSEFISSCAGGHHALPPWSHVFLYGKSIVHLTHAWTGSISLRPLYSSRMAQYSPRPWLLFGSCSLTRLMVAKSWFDLQRWRLKVPTRSTLSLFLPRLCTNNFSYNWINFPHLDLANRHPPFHLGQPRPLSTNENGASRGYHSTTPISLIIILLRKAKLNQA
ncbi:hypothetical protein VNO77_34456 [Canavalia gladiata]|uniref:Uncharacterized protein n=1 Tax=Canavalia gladiata TaxID=3824 RepID=A0AAN9PZT3_CANGL